MATYKGPVDGPALKLGRKRALTITGLVVVVVLAWVNLLLGAQMDVPTMDTGNGQTMGRPSQWSLEYAVIVFIMWAVMMVAVMLPSAAKAVLFAATLDDQPRSLLAVRRAGMLAAGYLAVWLVFSLAATAAQWALDEAGLLSPTMVISNTMLAGSLLVYAGVYQWNPLKQDCLAHCRGPQEFLARHWQRDGPFGTGLRHGLFCLGCCWMLMALLFVGGLMNLACIAVISVAILAEKMLPHGVWISRAIGTTLIAGGTAELASLDGWQLFSGVAQLI